MTPLSERYAEAGKGLAIRSVDAFTLHVPTTPRSTAWTFARVTTEDGYTGIGEGIGTPAPVCAAIEWMGRGLAGESAWDVERLWVALYRATEFTRSGVNHAAISAIDTALWDIVGKRLGVPVYALLGGKVNARVPIYHHPWDLHTGQDSFRNSFREGRPPEGYAEFTRELVRQGIVSGKLDPFPREAGFSREISPQALEFAVEVVRQIREGGPQFNLMVEMHARFNVASAIRIAKALEPHVPFWLEEPVPPENVQETREVQLATHLTVATGERLYTRHDFRSLLEARACRIIQPDLAHVGGITEMRKIANLADAYYVTYCPHSYNGPVTLLAGAHVGTTTPNLLMHEWHQQLKGVLEDTVVGGYTYDPQYFDVPDAPGLGIELPDAYIREHRIDPMTFGDGRGIRTR
ncbi:MAG TPA: mandelate racemase/muconate lactonizing enzyme family protein [Chloroflexota bacterium]|jgi:galactonate dehydratase|nr:mandelate racemase/muconate lactonizing enzyme family protein [Chloroflexota bacterium]